MSDDRATRLDMPADDAFVSRNLNRVDLGKRVLALPYRVKSSTCNVKRFNDARQLRLPRHNVAEDGGNAPT